MPSTPLDPGVLQRLRAHSTPTICNAVETFEVRPRDQGFMDAGVRCVLPHLPPMVGFAVTARIVAAGRPQTTDGPGRYAFWEHVCSVPAPRVVVIEDMDPTPVGSYWGEVQANIHRALECAGAVTNGGVRDVEEVAALGFPLFASCLLVSHAYVRLVEIGGPVRVGGLEVRPGDLLHGDRHGVTHIPTEVAPHLDAAVDRLARREAEILAACQAEPFDLPRLRRVYGAGAGAETRPREW